MESQAQTEKPKTKKHLPNRCLGTDKNGVRCKVMLPEKRHVCKECQKRINRIGGKTVGSKVGRRLGNPLSDLCD